MKVICDIGQVQHLLCLQTFGFQPILIKKHLRVRRIPRTHRGGGPVGSATHW